MKHEACSVRVLGKETGHAGCHQLLKVSYRLAQELVFILKKVGIFLGFNAGKECNQIWVLERCLRAALRMMAGGRKKFRDLTWFHGYFNSPSKRG